MQIPEPNATNFEPAPAGTHVATCFRIVDLGTQNNTFKGDTKTQHQLTLAWELANKVTKSGRPVVVAKTLNLSMHEKATFRSFVEAMMARALTKADLYGKDRLDIRSLLGKSCLITIQHAEAGDKVSARIIACVPLPEGMPRPQATNSEVFLSLSPSLFDQETFDSLSSWTKEKIMASPEYAALTATATSAATPAAEIIDDEIPF
jgi:hypothetical protein